MTCLSGAGGDVDPTTLLAILTTEQIDGNNEPRWSDPAYDEIVRRQATILDAKARKAAVDEAQRLAYEAAPYIILAYDGDIQAVRKDKIQGLVRIVGDGPVFYANTNLNYLKAAPASQAKSGGGRTVLYVLIAAAIILIIVVRAFKKSKRKA